MSDFIQYPAVNLWNNRQSQSGLYLESDDTIRATLSSDGNYWSSYSSNSTSGSSMSLSWNEDGPANEFEWDISFSDGETGTGRIDRIDVNYEDGSVHEITPGSLSGSESIPTGTVGSVNLLLVEVNTDYETTFTGRIFIATFESGSGTVTSAVTSGDGAAQAVDAETVTDSSVSGSDASITVYQDTTGDGTADNSDTVALDGGVESVPVSGFDRTGDYWIEANISTVVIDTGDDETQYIDGAVEVASVDAPANNSIDDARATELDQSWDLVDDAAVDGYLVYRAPSGGAFTQVADLSATTSSYTHTGLDIGQEYEVQVASYTATAVGRSEIVAAATIAPDEAPPTLNNGVKDEITVERNRPDGSYPEAQFQIRQTGGSTWDADAAGFDEQLVEQGIESFAFGGLLDGEEYEVRGRVNTDFQTGDWTDPVSIVTAFPGAVELVATVVDETTVDLTWIENADNEDGQLIVREKRFPDGSWGHERVLEDVGPDTEAYTDTSAQPGTEYRYRVRAYTQYAEADSNTEIAATDDIGLSRTPVPASGWKVEITAPNGDTLRPTILTGAEYDPVLNDLPAATLPVAGGERWTDAGLEEQPIRVWKDGVELPTDQVDGIRERDDDTAEIVAVAGGDLRERIQLEIFEDDVHEVARDVITEVGLIPYVDDPDAQTLANTPLGEASNEGQWSEFLGVDDVDDADRPWWVDPNGELQLRERVAAFEQGIETTSSNGDVGVIFDDRFTSGSALRWGSSSPTTQAATWQLETDVRIQPDDLALSLLVEDLADDHYGFEVFVDGTTMAYIPADSLGGSDPELGYQRFSNGDGPSSEVGDGLTEPLEPGTHDVTITIREDSAGTENVRWYVDALVLHPEWHWTPDGSETIVNQTVDQPDLIATGETVESAPLDSFLTIEAAELTSAWTNTAGDQAVALSADGETWIEEANSESVLAEFGADAGLQATARFRLGGTSEGAVDGLDALDTPQACTEVDVQGDLNDTPLVLSKSYDDRAVNILSDLADRGDYIWEARPAAWVDDVAADVGTVISMTRPGQRESTLDTDLVRYVYETRADRRADQVVIKGSSDEIRGEEFIASVSDGSDRSVLDRQFIVNGSESVYDPALDEQYERTVDYRMEYISGRIEVLPGGSIDDGQELQIDYRGKAAGAYPDSDVLASGPRVVVETISSLTSDVECQQAALYLYRQLADPLVEAEVTIPRIDPRQSLVEAVDIEQLPGDDPYQLREIQMGESVSIRLQNRQTASERFADLEDRISQIAEQT